MSISSELFQIASQLEKYSDYDTPELEALAEAAENVGKSWSKSTLGYHSRVYYAGFRPCRPGEVFDAEWGLDGIFGIRSQSVGNWVEYSFEDVEKVIREKAGNPSTDRSFADSERAREAFETAKSSVLSITSTNHFESNRYLQSLLEKIESLEIKLNTSAIQAYLPQGKRITSSLSTLN